MNTPIRACARASPRYSSCPPRFGRGARRDSRGGGGRRRPQTPEDLELTAGGDSSITVSWEASPGATSYRIYRGTAAGGEGATPIATTTGTSYKDTNLSPTPIYFYQVTAVNSAGESAAHRRGRVEDPATDRHRRQRRRRAGRQLDWSTTARTPCSAASTGSRP